MNRDERQRAERAEVRAMTRRLLRHFDNASAADMAAGLAWYARAEREAAALAAGTHLTRDQAAGVIAALSPRVQWQPNLDGAAAMIAAAADGQPAAPVVAGLPDNRAKAWRIASGGDPSEVLRGPKVCAFFANITGDHVAVTVDVWAARAAEGCDNASAPTGRRYERVAEAYRRAAAARGITPRECQAAIWVHVRGAAEGSYRPSTRRVGVDNRMRKG